LQNILKLFVCQKPKKKKLSKKEKKKLLHNLNFKKENFGIFGDEDVMRIISSILDIFQEVFCDGIAENVTCFFKLITNNNISF
jgi:hypothetical protein